MSSKRQRLMELAKLARSRSWGPLPLAAELPSAPVEMRPVRRGQGVWQWPAKLYFRVPLITKTRFCETARSFDLNQAELGIVIVERALLDSRWLWKAVDAYRRSQEATRVASSLLFLKDLNERRAA